MCKKDFSGAEWQFGVKLEEKFPSLGDQIPSNTTRISIMQPLPLARIIPCD